MPRFGRIAESLTSIGIQNFASKFFRINCSHCSHVTRLPSGFFTPLWSKWICKRPKSLRNLMQSACRRGNLPPLYPHFRSRTSSIPRCNSKDQLAPRRSHLWEWPAPRDYWPNPRIPFCPSTCHSSWRCRRTENQFPSQCLRRPSEIRTTQAYLGSQNTFSLKLQKDFQNVRVESACQELRNKAFSHFDSCAIRYPLNK